uniref:Uncharacterized protein n=1 Tax=Arundo donax TaxID=35708 RepID=A0A0A9HHH9_ARUDO
MFSRVQCCEVRNYHHRLVAITSSMIDAILQPCLRPVCTVLKWLKKCLERVVASMPCQCTRFCLGCCEWSRAEAEELLGCFSWRFPWPPCVMRTCTDCLTREQNPLRYARHRISHPHTASDEAAPNHLAST